MCYRFDNCDFFIRQFIQHVHEPINLAFRRDDLPLDHDALLASGEVGGVEDRSRDTERWLDTTANRRARPHPAGTRPWPGWSSCTKKRFAGSRGSIAVYRAGLALVRGDVPATVAYARQALDLTPLDDHFRRGAAAALLGLASWTSGDLEAAHRTYAKGMVHLQMAGNIADAVGGAIALADIRIAQGRLREVMRTYEQALQLATAQGEPLLRGAADMHVGMSALERERNNLKAARQHLVRSQELGEHIGFPQYPYRWRVAMARIRQAESDLDGALALLDEAEQRYMSDFSPDVRPVAALKTRVWVTQGRLGDALDWVREQGLSAQDELSYGREFEHITLARVLLAQYQSERADRSIREALRLLERLLHAAEAGERTGSVIEILVLQALAHQMQGDIPAALVPLQRAMTLAEPEDYVRLLVDEGPPMAVLLGKAAKHRDAPTYVRRLLAAFGTAADRPPGNQVVIEPLSDRERGVLRLLGTDLDGPDIARALMVSLSTLRTHTRNIYTKLGVNSRRAAVRRAEELHLL